MKRLLLPIACTAVISLLIGCPAAPGGGNPGEGENPGDAQKVDDLFVEQPGFPGKYEFQTNDTAYWGQYGYTLWTIKGSPQTPFEGRDVILNKLEGNGAAGYGIVFCQYDSGSAAVGETMLVVMINTQQEYIVGEVVEAQFSEIIPWTQSNLLSAGYNQGNRLNVTYDSVKAEYSLSINGTFVTAFRDDEAPVHSGGGGDGYIVVISPLDQFPKTYVHVIFQEQ